MSERIQVEQLQQQVDDFFQANAPQYGLNAGALRITYVLNAGGFVNHSFRIHDGQRRLHLKLCTFPETRSALKRWFEVRQRLEQYYHAPTVLGWITLPDAEGLLFPHLHGHSPGLTEKLVSDVLPVLRSLALDPHIAEHIRDGRPITARSVYLEGLHDRFEEDLRTIREQCPAFVSPALLEWMTSEVAHLEEWVRTHDSFAQPLTSPVHGDLWLNNMLVTPGGQWFLLDWDDLRIGDPVMDLATLAGPSAADVAPLKLRSLYQQALTSDERARLELLGRATLLDWIIDPLADYIDADVAPAHVAAVRQETERIHRAALELYQNRYAQLLT